MVIDLQTVCHKKTAWTWNFSNNWFGSLKTNSKTKYEQKIEYEQNAFFRTSLVWAKQLSYRKGVMIYCHLATFLQINNNRNSLQEASKRSINNVTLLHASCHR